MKKELISSWMEVAIKQAELAYQADEVPVGAIIIDDKGKMIGRGYNQCESLCDPTAHAEMIAITAATSTLGNWRLNGCSLFVTKEPCLMCTGAIVNARISSLYFGVYDPVKGCCGSAYQLCMDPIINSTTSYMGGVLENKCQSLLADYFTKKRVK